MARATHPGRPLHPAGYVLDPEKLIQRPSGRGDGLRIGRLLVLVLRRREAVAGAAVYLELEAHVRTTQFVDHAVDGRERIALVLGAVQDQVHSLDVLGPSRLVAAERAVDRDIGGERRTGCAELDP